MNSDHKTLRQEPAVQPPETKFTAVGEESRISGPTGIATRTAGRNSADGQRKVETVQVALRLLCVVTSLTALAFMVTAEQASVASIYGFQIPIRSKWSFSDSFE